MPAGKPRRPRRDHGVRERLDQVREVMRERRHDAKRREAATIEAAATYLHAAASIRDCDSARDQQIGELRRQIEQRQREHETESSRWRDQQASAVLSMRALGETDDSIGELLELTVKQVRQLAASARAAEQPKIESGVEESGGGLDSKRRPAPSDTTTRAAQETDSAGDQSLA